MAGNFIVQDSFLYVAPEKPGVYRLENDTEGVKGEVSITVDSNAPTQKKPEEFSFGVEDKSKEPYRALAERYAPMFAQETWWQPKSDFPTRFDFLPNDSSLASNHIPAHPAHRSISILPTFTFSITIASLGQRRRGSGKLPGTGLFIATG